MARLGRVAAAVGLCGGLVVGLGALPASAAPSTGDGTTANLLYSVNGGAWSDSVTAQRGDTVTARLFYDTTKESTVDGVSLSSQIPDGFTYLPGSTRNVLAPGSNVATGAVGSETKAAAVADNVWSGDTFTVSPSAGFNGESNASQSGVLRNGVKRYLNLHECGYFNASSGFFFTNGLGRGTGAGLGSTGTNAGNSAQASATCDPSGGGGAPLNVSTTLPLELLGNRYLNLNECAYFNSTTGLVLTNGQGRGNDVGVTGTNTANTAQTSAACSAIVGGGAPLSTSTNLALDLLGNRYVNLNECAYSASSGIFFTNGLGRGTGAGLGSTGTNASNAAQTTATCDPSGGGGAPFLTSTNLALDLLDTARGQGFIEFAFTSEVPEPAQCGETVTEPELVSNRTGVLSGAGTGNPSSSASVTLAEYLDEGEPCPVPVELVDDAASTVVDGPTEIDLVGNDTIPEGSSAVVVDAASAQGGTVVDNGDGTVTYTPAPGFVGTDSFTYRVTGPDGVEVSATVTVTVTEDDEPPVPMVAGGFAAAGLLGLAGLGTARTLRNRRQD